MPGQRRRRTHRASRSADCGPLRAMEPSRSTTAWAVIRPRPTPCLFRRHVLRAGVRPWAPGARDLLHGLRTTRMTPSHVPNLAPAAAPTSTCPARSMASVARRPMHRRPHPARPCRSRRLFYPVCASLGLDALRGPSSPPSDAGRRGPGRSAPDPVARGQSRPRSIAAPVPGTAPAGADRRLVWARTVARTAGRLGAPSRRGSTSGRRAVPWSQFSGRWSSG